jgi:hypothetical protein
MRTGMKKLLVIVIITLICTTISNSGCRVPEPGTKPEPYEYTHTTELRQFEIYENDHIEGADRSLVMNLAQLGYPDLTLDSSEEAGAPAIEYTLPDDATQGPDTWYIIRFHFLIEFDETTGGGFCSVAAKGASASVHFDTLRVNDSPLIRVSGEPETSTSISLDVCYYNYMSLSSVKPGKNEMTFRLEESQGAKVKSVTIFNDTGIEATNVPPSDYDAERKLTQEEQAAAKELAFSDPGVQALVEGKEYALRITKGNGVVRAANEPPDNDIEVRLVFAETYLIDGVEADALDIFVDLKEEKITYIFPLIPSGMPELTESAKEKAVNIALSDADVQKLLAGKEYEITRIGPCQGGPVGRLGANMDITFDRAYPFQGDFPYFPEERKYLDKPIEGIEVFVNLKNERVIQIWPDISPEAPMEAR